MSKEDILMKSRTFLFISLNLVFFLTYPNMGWAQAPREETEKTAQHLATLLNVGRLVGMSILFSAIFSGIEMLWVRQFGFLKETLIAQRPLAFSRRRESDLPVDAAIPESRHAQPLPGRPDEVSNQRHLVGIFCASGMKHKVICVVAWNLNSS